MRRGVAAGILAIGTAALARPAPAAGPSWADWIGDWQGKLKWTSCTADGEPAATLAVDATNSAVAIDLSGAAPGLGPIALTEDNGGWFGHDADVTVHLARTHDDAGLELAIDLDSGCQVRATLRRETVGIPACDRLAAWARIEGRCTKLVKPALEHAARLARQRAQWRKARGDDRDELADQCAARAAKVEAELATVGCAPKPPAR
ncbi:MAG TPA: hypothetical protein VGF94_05365 [Kofleriaceae bacterium]|jgi:hypothetical protein